MKVGRKPASRASAAAASGTAAPARRRRADGPAAPARRRLADSPARKRRPADGPARPVRSRAGTRTRPQESRGLRQGPQTAPTARPVDRPVRPKTTSQAKARAKARKAKAPKVIRTPLRDRLIARLAAVDLSPRTLLAKVPFVVLIIGALAVGLGITLWLSTASAQRSYQLGTARALNDALSQQKEALERDVLEAQSAPALADAARNLGMIPSRDTAHLVQDPAGNWIVVGQPKPAEGAPPPPLNTKLPDEKPPAPAKPALPPAAVKPKPGSVAEVPTRAAGPVIPGATGPVIPGATGPVIPGATGPEVPVPLPVLPDPFSAHASAGAGLPGPAPLPWPVAGAPAAPAAPPAPPASDAPPQGLLPPVPPAPPVAVAPPTAPIVPVPAPAGVVQ
jgi:hypothetical protein